MDNTQTEKIKIDSDKLRKLILEKEDSVDDCSTQLGYSRKYLAGCLSARTVSKPISMLLELKYGIKSEDYLAEKPVEKSNEPDNSVEVCRHLDRGIELLLAQLDSIGNDVNEETEGSAKLAKTVNVTCNIIQKTLETIVSNQERQINLTASVEQNQQNRGKNEMNSYAEIDRQEQMYKAKCEEDASVLDLKIVSALCKMADVMLYGIDFEVAKNVDTQYIADELAEYIVENYQ